MKIEEPALRYHRPGQVAKAIKGDPKYPSVHNGRLYYLANADAKKAFEGDPEGMLAKAEANWPRLK